MLKMLAPRKGSDGPEEVPEVGTHYSEDPGLQSCRSWRKAPRYHIRDDTCGVWDNEVAAFGICHKHCKSVRIEVLLDVLWDLNNLLRRLWTRCLFLGIVLELHQLFTTKLVMAHYLGFQIASCILVVFGKILSLDHSSRPHFPQLSRARRRT